jgi:hypothetical protein
MKKQTLLSLVNYEKRVVLKHSKVRNSYNEITHTRHTKKKGVEICEIDYIDRKGVGLRQSGVHGGLKNASLILLHGFFRTT